MRSIHKIAAASFVMCCGLLISCDSRGGASLTEVFDQPGLSGLPFDGALSARVRNESSSRVDVTMRFVRAEREPHEARVVVPVKTVTTVFSPDMAEMVELSGINEQGDVLPPAAFYYGVDFDETRPAEYVVIDRSGADPEEPWVVVTRPGTGQNSGSETEDSGVQGGTASGDDAGDDPIDDESDDETDQNDADGEGDDVGSGGDAGDGNDDADDEDDTGSDAGTDPGDSDSDQDDPIDEDPVDDDADDDVGDDDADASDDEESDPDGTDDDEGNGVGGDDQGTGAGSDDGSDDVLEPGIVVIGRPGDVPQQRAVPNDSTRFVIGWLPETPVIPAGMYLTNIPYGGDVEVPIVPPADWRPTSRDPFMQLEVPYDSVPNEAWPRSFDLVVQYQTARGLKSVVAPRPFWIPQLVEVMEATAHNMPCRSRSPMGRNLFAGIELHWYGGGVAPSRRATSVSFWLSRDGTVPADFRDDAEHRLLFVTTGSPNFVQLSYVDADTVFFGGVWVSPAGDVWPTREGGPENAGAPVALVEGDYQIVVVGDYGEFGQLVTTAELPPITICPPVLHND